MSRTVRHFDLIGRMALENQRRGLAGEALAGDGTVALCYRIYD